MAKELAKPSPPALKSRKKVGNFYSDYGQPKETFFARFNVNVWREKSRGNKLFQHVGLGVLEIYRPPLKPSASELKGVRVRVILDGVSPLKVREEDWAFDAAVPNAVDAHESMYGNAGRDPFLIWEAMNERFGASGNVIEGADVTSTATGSRRYYINFQHNIVLKYALYLMFPDHREIADEFFQSDGRFLWGTYTRPINDYVLEEEDMEVDWEQRRLTMSRSDAVGTFGNDPFALSQGY